MSFFINISFFVVRSSCLKHPLYQHHTPSSLYKFDFDMMFEYKDTSSIPVSDVYTAKGNVKRFGCFFADIHRHLGEEYTSAELGVVE